MSCNLFLVQPQKNPHNNLRIGMPGTAQIGIVHQHGDLASSKWEHRYVNVSAIAE